MNSREKGKRVELHFVHKLNESGFTARRGQQFCGANGDADIIVDELSDYHIEIKGVERLNYYDAMEQSTRDAKAGETPILMHKKNRKPELVTMYLDDWIKLWRKANDNSAGR